MLCTVGHSNRTLPELVTILISHDINFLVDVRGGKAGSRAFPHFNTENLVQAIPAEGIQYKRLPELGGRRGKTVGADLSLNNEWRLDAFRCYADYAYYSDAFDGGIDDLVELGVNHNVAFMCSEAVPWRCHRSIITDWLVMTRDQTVTHLLSPTQTMVGKPHAHAKLYNGRVIYPTEDLFTVTT